MNSFDLTQKQTVSQSVPARSGLVQRRCACGKPIGINSQCEECGRKRFLPQQSPGSSESKTAESPETESQNTPEPGKSRFGFDFGQIAIMRPPCKALDEGTEEMNEDKPDPAAGGSATIKCDGKGGYELLLRGWESAACGTKDCVIRHETSHMNDWKAKWPTGCKDQPQGYLPKGDPPDVPLMTSAEYSAFLKDSECRAHTTDLACANALKPADDACKKTVKEYIELTETQKKAWC